LIDLGLVLEYALVVDAGDLGEVVSGQDEAVQEDPEWLALWVFPVKRYGVEGYKCVVEVR
jgi:hypothetical protein